MVCKVETMVRLGINSRSSSFLTASSASIASSCASSSPSEAFCFLQLIASCICTLSSLESMTKVSIHFISLSIGSVSLTRFSFLVDTDPSVCCPVVAGVGLVLRGVAASFSSTFSFSAGPASASSTTFSVPLSFSSCCSWRHFSLSLFLVIFATPEA
ncbi:hypothetical protein Tsubulata_006406 [Turnera subulata]|uniref:Uncharacterized protein n=1 Tax=Turnera subulata TaxID=218843 RepID=A0A9Q0EZ47_9ROSI|nr:hypothetical protein Tsubulata_006406 [Turnera subulata]